MRTRDPPDRTDRLERIDTDVAAPLRAVEVSLDELHRARLCAAIEAGLDRSSAARAGWRGDARPRGAGRTLAFATVGVAAGAAAVLAVLIVGVRLPGRSPTPMTPIAMAAMPALFTPYLYAGPGVERAALEPSSRLTVPAGARVRAAIDTRVRMTLVGPAALSLVKAQRPGNIELRLDSGALFVDYDGSAGGVLKIRSPGAVTTVVGTLFSVEASGGTSRIAVARGQVRAEAGHTTQRLPTGTAWTASGGPVQPIPADLAAALGEHDASPPPPVGEYGLVYVDGAGDAAASPRLTLDGRPLAAAPLVARIPAGNHLVGGSDRSVTVAIAGGARVRLDAPAASEGAHSTAVPAPSTVVAPGARPGARLASRSRWQDGARRHAAPAQVPAPDAAPAAVSTVDLESVYAAAEAEMRFGHRDRARQRLHEIVARDPRGPRAEAALLDLARLALADGNPGDARRYLARLPERLDDAALSEPVDHLRCSTDLRLGDVAAARRCLTLFRGRYPRSLHDAEALALLAAQGGDCGQARPLLVEYLRRYPRGPFAADARARLSACE